MAFTINLDKTTSEALRCVMQTTGIKTKNKALIFLIHSFETHQRLEQEYYHLQCENQVLCDVNFVRKILSQIEARIAPALPTTKCHCADR